MITLDTIDSALHSVEVKSAAGNALAIAGDGSIAVTDNGGSLTIDSTDLATIAGAVSGTEMQVDVITMPTVTVTATDLDIRDLAFATDSVDVSGSSVSVSGTVQVASAGLDSWQVSTTTATTTAGELAATPLGSRLRMIIQNLGNSDVYLGPDNTVSTSDMKLPKGSSLEFPFGATANIWAITSSGTADLRVSEFAD